MKNEKVNDLVKLVGIYVWACAVQSGKYRNFNLISMKSDKNTIKSWSNSDVSKLKLKYNYWVY